MANTEVLLIINSILLGVISLLFLVIGYFLKNLHRDFKHMVEKVGKLHNELYSHLNLFENLSKLFQKQIDSLKERVKKLERSTSKKK